MSRKVAGRYAIAVDGELLALEGEATVNFGFDENEAIVGPSGMEGFASNPQAPQITFSMVYRADFDLSRLNGVTDAEVSFDAPNGETWVLREAFSVGTWEYTTSRGAVSAGFSGMSFEKAS